MTESEDALKKLEAMRQENIGRLFLRAHRAYSTRAVVLLRERGHEGLSLAHTSLLANLDTSGTRITTLAERAGMTKQSMSQLVVDLEGRGYIQRNPDPIDKRAVIVHFTEKGWQFLRDSYEIKLILEREYAAILGDAAMHELRRLLCLLLESTDGDAE